MSPFLVDAVGFLALLFTLLVVTERKGVTGAWAVVGAALWWVGGVVGLLVAARVDGDPLPWSVVGRVVGLVAGAALVASRPTSLPTRVVDGRAELCVYRAPGPFEPEAVAAFLAEQGLRAAAEPWAVWVDARDAGRARKLLPGFVAPRRVYVGGSPADAHMVAAWLQQHGLPCQVRGDDRSGAMGGIPVHESFAEVWARGADVDRAEALLAALAAEGQGEAWTCPRCGEASPPAFGSCWSCGAGRPAAAR